MTDVEFFDTFASTTGAEWKDMYDKANAWAGGYLNISKTIIKIIVCGAIMGAVLFALNGYFADTFSQNTPHKIWILIGIITAGKTTYTIATALIKTVTLRDIKGALHK